MYNFSPYTAVKFRAKLKFYTYYMVWKWPSHCRPRFDVWGLRASGEFYRDSKKALTIEAWWTKRKKKEPLVIPWMLDRLDRSWVCVGNADKRMCSILNAKQMKHSVRREKRITAFNTQYLQARYAYFANGSVLIKRINV